MNEFDISVFYSNMHLGPNACLLMIITRADITFTTDESYDLKMPFRQPHRSWWGILPLRSESPFYSPEESILESKEFDGAFVNAGITIVYEWVYLNFGLIVLVCDRYTSSSSFRRYPTTCHSGIG